MEANWSQKELAERLEHAGWTIDPSAIARTELGERTLLDTELKFFLDVFAKDWADLLSEREEPKYCPKPLGGLGGNCEGIEGEEKKLNQYGELIRRWRTELGWSQEELAVKLQVAGWDIDRSLIALIENGKRSLLDYELKFFLDALGGVLTRKKLD